MHMIVLYSTGCPKCGILKKKLDERGMQYQENTAVEEMLSLGITSVPVLCVDGQMLDFSNAVKWINAQGGLIEWILH